MALYISAIIIVIIIAVLVYISTVIKSGLCGEPAISLHSHHVSLVQWTIRLLPVTSDLVSNPLGVLM